MTLQTRLYCNRHSRGYYAGEGCPTCKAECVGITSNEAIIRNMSVEKISDFASNSVIAKEIWNAAIEAAAVREAEVHGEGAAIRIRKLKK